VGEEEYNDASQGFGGNSIGIGEVTGKQGKRGRGNKKLGRGGEVLKEKIQANVQLIRVLFALGLREVFRRIPHTKSFSLEEAEAAIRSPPAAQASYPFRTTPSDDGLSTGPHPIPGPSWGTGRGQTSSGGRSGPAAHEDDGGCYRTTKPSSKNLNNTQCASAFSNAGESSSRKKGSSAPRHSKLAQKYSVFFPSKPVESLLANYMKKNKFFTKDPDYYRTCLGLVAASLAKNTWKRYNSALSLWEKFRKELNAHLDFLDVNSWDKNFLIWGWRDKRLNINTLKIYLGELREMGRLARGLETMDQDIGKPLIRGMSNLSVPREKCQIPTRPLTIADLREIRKGLESHDQKLMGQSVWAGCVIAFWGAFRLG
jgi:hypothetical protein